MGRMLKAVYAPEFRAEAVKRVESPGLSAGPGAKRPSVQKASGQLGGGRRARADRRSGASASMPGSAAPLVTSSGSPVFGLAHRWLGVSEELTQAGPRRRGRQRGMTLKA